MNSPTETWPFFLVRLANRPANVLALALALNALVQPYLGLTHDSRLYAAAVSERVAPGSFGRDLYLAYGSQDRYSVFAELLTPLVAVLGVHAAFFLVYLASKALLFWGALRLLTVLLRDRVAVLLSLAFFATVPVPYGGNEIFHLNESFLTPRLAACGLVMLALERFLAERPGQFFASLAGAFLLHPLMAVAGALVAALCFVSLRLSIRWLTGLTIGSALGAGFVLWYEPLGNRLLGHMDDDWRDATLAICFFIRPSKWLAIDWLRLVTAFAVIFGAARAFRGNSARMLLAVALTGLVGIIGQVCAVSLHYRLLVQTSPYRTIWLTEFLCVPLLLLGVVRAWRAGTPGLRAAALGLLLVGTTVWDGVEWTEALAVLGVFAASALVWRGLGRDPRRADWAWPAGLTTFGAAVALLTLRNVVVLRTLLTAPPDLHLDLHPVVFLMALLGVMARLPLLLLTFSGLRPLTKRLGMRSAFALSLLALCIGYQALLTAADRSSSYGERFSSTYRERRFVADALGHSSDTRPATIYWPNDVREIWFGVRANSYFNVVQLSGCAFNRGTALEGRRRGELVHRFEMAALKREKAADTSFWANALKCFCRTDCNAPPSAADLVRLCEDPVLDAVVLEEQFPGLYSTTDGKYYIYDCARIRAAYASRSR